MALSPRPLLYQGVAVVTKRTSEFLARLDSVKETPSGWTAKCPFHKGGREGSPSLDIKEGREGILIQCRSHGCTHAEIAHSVGWEVADLFWDSHKNGKHPYHLDNGTARRSFTSVASGATMVIGRGRDASMTMEHPPPPHHTEVTETCVAEHDYRSAEGEPLLRVRRLHRTDPRRAKGYKKACIPYHREGDDWKRCKDCHHQVPLYRLPELLAAPESVVVWVEGENKADALVARGVLATTALGGTGRKNKLPDLEPLRGRKVCILPDKDEVGEQYAEHVRHALDGIARRCWIVSDYPDEEEPPQGYDVVDWLENHEITQLLPALEPPQHKPRYRVLSIRELLAEPEADWQIVDVIQDDGLWMLFGEPSHGKSFIAMDMMLCLTLGGNWCGKEIRKSGPVVYVNADGGRGFRDRIDAWFVANGEGQDIPFHTINAALPISDDQMVAALIEDLDALEISPVAICLDTWSRCLAGMDENDQGTISGTIRNMDRLREKYQCSVGTLHHTDSTGRKPRGSTVLLGAVDSAWRVVRQEGSIGMTCYKQRNGQDDLEGFRFRLQRVPGMNQVALMNDGPGDRMNERARQQIRALNYITEHPNCTSAELQQALGLSQQRVSEIGAALMREGVIEKGPPRPTRGAPAPTVRLKEDR